MGVGIDIYGVGKSHKPASLILHHYITMQYITMLVMQYTQ